MLGKDKDHVTSPAETSFIGIGTGEYRYILVLVLLSGDGLFSARQIQG